MNTYSDKARKLIEWNVFVPGSVLERESYQLHPKWLASGDWTYYIGPSKQAQRLERGAYVAKLRLLGDNGDEGGTVAGNGEAT